VAHRGDLATAKNQTPQFFVFSFGRWGWQKTGHATPLAKMRLGDHPLVANLIFLLIFKAFYFIIF
jgi:hypothetical protein